jgi:hypothetical protein
MSFDDNYGYFLDAPFVLTRKEYSAKVLLDEELLQTIQNNIDLPYEKNKDGTIAFNFGDLPTHISIFERLNWKEFYRGIRCSNRLRR